MSDIPPSPPKPAKPPPPKPSRHRHTGPAYEYELVDYTAAARAETFRRYGAAGWRFVGTEAAGTAVFERVKAGGAQNGNWRKWCYKLKKTLL